jgi:aryl-alcohol dehydrogenase-like predicted oxidoreductase
MKFNEFGKTGMTVSEIGFGGSRIGGVFAGRNGRSEALHVLRMSLDSGVNFFDTADLYAHGESESLIGTAFRGRRDQVILATKGGFSLPARGSIMKRIKPVLRPVVRALKLSRAKLPSGISGALSQDFSPPYLIKALEASLRRLQTDYVDLYQLHSPGTPFLQSAAFGESLETLEKLRNQGKIRFYGVATELPQDAPFCLSASGISSVQIGFGLLNPEALDQGTLAAAEARGLAVICRGCFGGGLLKDGLDGAQLEAATPRWRHILELRSLSSTLGRPVLDAAFQFCRSTPPICVTLLGMRVEAHLRENLRYCQAPPLTAAEYQAFRRLQKAQEDPAG